MSDFTDFINKIRELEENITINIADETIHSNDPTDSSGTISGDSHSSSFQSSLLTSAVFTQGSFDSNLGTTGLHAPSLKGSNNMQDWLLY